MRVYVVRKWWLWGGKSFCVLEYHANKYLVTAQRAFRAKYAKYRPTDKTIRAWYIQFSENGCCASRNQVVAYLTLKTLN